MEQGRGRARAWWKQRGTAGATMPRTKQRGDDEQGRPRPTELGLAAANRERGSELRGRDLGAGAHSEQRSVREEMERAGEGVGTAERRGEKQGGARRAGAGGLESEQRERAGTPWLRSEQGEIREQGLAASRRSRDRAGRDPSRKIGGRQREAPWEGDPSRGAEGGAGHGGGKGAGRAHDCRGSRPAGRNRGRRGWGEVGREQGDGGEEDRLGSGILSQTRAAA